MSYKHSGYVRFGLNVVCVEVRIRTQLTLILVKTYDQLVVDLTLITIDWEFSITVSTDFD